MNKLLVNTLYFKIGATFVAWCLPLLFFPKAWLVSLGFPTVEPFFYLELLGWAYLALLVGYTYGLLDALKGKIAMHCISMGIVSNLGAGSMMLYAGFQGTWVDWGWYAQVHMWGSGLGAFGIGTTLLYIGITAPRNAPSPQTI